MVAGKLSVIIPFCNEHPQIAFTVQSIYNELRDRCNFEIICIDNWVDNPAVGECGPQDNGYKYMRELAENAKSPRPWLKVLEYRTKLSHWNAKNVGVQASEGEFLWFCDSHCIVPPNSLFSMFDIYSVMHPELNGTMHLPLSYMLDVAGRELIYKFAHNLETGLVHYKFTRYPELEHPKPLFVPCMSTCGMMMTRELYDYLGGWPSEMGIYGGGEHFINFTLGVLGKNIVIYPAKPLYHYAAPRGYSYAYDDMHRNRTIATMMYGGEELAYRYIMNIRGGLPQKTRIWRSVRDCESVNAQAQDLKTKHVITIEEFVAKWTEKSSSLEGD